jgi:hypothetical protein
MNESQWDAKLKSFLKKTGDDFKRFGTDVKEEAQKLLTEVQDPARQQKLRDGLKDVGVWAKKTAEEVATLVETGVKKAEGAIGKASDKVNDFVVKPVEPAPASAAKTTAPAATPPSPPPQMDEAAPRKTVGKGAGKKKPAARNTAKKTIGKKGPPTKA